VVVSQLSSTQCVYSCLLRNSKNIVLDNKIHEYIRKGQFGEAIEELLNSTKSKGRKDLSNELLLQDAKLEKNKSGVRKGIISPEEANRINNQIGNSILEIYQSLKVGSTHLGWERNNKFLLRNLLVFFLVTCIARYTLSIFLRSKNQMESVGNIQDSVKTVISVDSTELSIDDESGEGSKPNKENTTEILVVEPSRTTKVENSNKNREVNKTAASSEPIQWDTQEVLLDPDKENLKEIDDSISCPCSIERDSGIAKIILVGKDYREVVDYKNGVYNWCNEKELMALDRVILVGVNGRKMKTKSGVGIKNGCPISNIK